MAWRSSPEAPLGRMRWGYIGEPIFRLAACIATVFAVTAVLYPVPLHDRSLTASLTFLLVVLIVSAFWGFRYAVFVSFLTALGFSWLLPPVGRFWLNDPRDVFTLAAILVIGITAGYFSDRARREALNANLRRVEAVAAQERFRDLVNSVEGIVWEADAVTCAFSFVSDQAEHILGYPTDTWINNPTFWKDHLHPEDRDRVVQFRAQATAEKRSHDIEYRMIAADERVVWLRDLVTVVVENSRPSRLRGVKIDITKRKQDEETLREQADLLTLTHDAIFVRDMSSTIKYWNRAAEEMYGWLAEEASGKTSHRFLKTVFPIPLEQIEAKLMSTGRWEGELAHTKKDGTPIVVASRWSLQQDNQGTPVAILEINNDITEQKKAEQARQEVEEQLKAAFESNPTMYFIIDAAGKIASVNSFGAEQLGYTVSELIGQPVLNIFYEPDRDVVQKHANECFEQPGQMMRWEARKIRKNGTMLWVRETANAVFLKNRPVLLVICEDITEQKRAEEAARRSEKELRDAIESVPAMVFVALPGPSNIFASRGWREYTGLSSEDTAGSGWQSAVHPEDMERYMEKWRACSATGEPFEDEARFRRAADGEYRWFLVRAVPLRDEQGNILKWYGVLTDIEDRKRAEALLTGEKRILEMVAKGDSLVQILDSLCRLVEEQASGVLASILLVDGDRLRHGGAPSLPKAYSDAMARVMIGPSAGSCGTAAYRGEQVIVEDIVADPLWVDYREAALLHSLRACWSTPIFSSQRKVIATFAMYYREPRSPSPRDQEIIQQITHLAGVAIERKLTQEALRRSETYLTEAQRLTHTGSWAFSPVTRKTLYWSDEMFRLWDFDPQQGPPDPQAVLQRVHPEDRERMRELFERGFEGQLTVDVVADHRIVLPDGTVRYHHGISHPVFDEAGEVVEYVGTAIDVTDRKRAEEELRESEERFRNMADTAPVMIWVSGVDKLCTYFNQQWLDFTGRMMQDELGNGWAEGVHPEDYERCLRTYNSAFNRRQPFRMEYRLRRSDGQFRWVDDTGVPRFSHGGEVFLGYIGSCADITDRKRAEEELRRSEAYLAESQKLTKTGSWAYNPFTGKTIYWSDEMFRIFGLDPQIGPSSEKFWQLVHPEDHDRVRKRVEREAHDSKEYSDEYRIILPDGTIKHILDIGHPVFNDAGDVVEFVGTTVDVTERKRAEEELRRSEAYLSEAQRLTHTGSWAYDPIRDEMIHFSEELYRIFGVDPQKVTPTREELWERVHPEDRYREREISFKLDREKGEHAVDYRLRFPDGTVKYIHSTRHPVLNGAGEIIEILGTTIDVTEQKRAEEELRAAETRFRTYVDHATDALFVRDEQGKVIDMNRRACESLGYTREELIGKTPMFFDPGIDEIWFQQLKERLEAGELVAFESTHQRKDGSMFPVEVRIRPFWHGGHRFTLSLARDISERKRAEHERERLRQIEEDLAHINRVSMMGELTASLAHEIKQPIAAAVSNAEACLQWLARDQPALVEMREAATEMVKEARRAAEIVTRTRSLFKKEGITREVLNLNEVITDTVYLIRDEADRSSISVRTELDAVLPRIAADRVQFQQVLLNLMLNGLEAMKGTGGELIIRSQRDEEGRPLISVSDVGIGLPVGKRDKIFDAFFTTKPQGIGMGLAISRSIVESHGGHLWATANAGRGATFYFTLANEVAESA